MVNGVTSIYFKANSEMLHVIPANGTDFTLEELQYLLGSPLRIVTLFEDKILIVNNRGKELGYPLNNHAPELPENPIYGDAILSNLRGGRSLTVLFNASDAGTNPG